MAILIKPNGKEQKVSPAHGKTFTLEELQEYVGGYIEALYLRNDKIMFVDEDGKLKNYPINQKATDIAQGQTWIAPWDMIVGTVIITDKNETE